MADSRCLAKDPQGRIKVTVKEKYGIEREYDQLTVVMEYNNSMYLIRRKGTVAILPYCNWAMTDLEYPDDTEDQPLPKGPVPKA